MALKNVNLNQINQQRFADPSLGANNTTVANTAYPQKQASLLTAIDPTPTAAPAAPAAQTGTGVGAFASGFMDGVSQAAQAAQNALNRKGTGGAAPKEATPLEPAADQWQSGYAPSQNVSDALSYLRQQEQAVSGIGPYGGSPYDQDIQNAYGAIMSRGKFNYDVNADALYQQYRNLYAENARQAALNAQGAGAGLTGGYGNSYAASAANQAAQQQMTQLNDRALDIYDRAYQRWQDEGGEMTNRLNTAVGMGDRDYSRWTDAYDRALNERNYAYQKYGDEWSRDYGMYQDQQQQDYNMVMAMLQYGLTPSAQMRRNAGISDQDFTTLQNYYKSKAKSRASGGGGKSGGVNDFLDYLEGQVNAGKLDADYATQVARVVSGLDEPPSNNQAREVPQSGGVRTVSGNALVPKKAK